MDDESVSLPCYDRKRWQILGRLFVLLAQCKRLSELQQLATLVKSSASFAGMLGKEQLLVMLSNLCKCLQKHFPKKDCEMFLCKTLPSITQLASELPKLVPPDGIPFLRQERAQSVSLSRHLVASLLASGFLCAFSTPMEQGIREDSGLNFDQFFAVFSWEDKDDHHATQLMKLKSILSYFNRIANNQCDLDGLITISRNIVSHDQLPTIKDWEISDCDLCSVAVKTTREIGTDEAHALQVIMASRAIGSNMLQSGRTEEELTFCQFPELLVMLLVCDEMESNEALLIKGAAQFCQCRGCGASLDFIGEYYDQSKRDSFGTYQNLMVAIDAVPFRSKKADNQYRQSYVLRELNKALVGFYCVEMRGDAMVDSVNDVRKVMKSTGSPVDFVRNNSIYAEWKIGRNSTTTDEVDASDISAFASSIVHEVVTSVTNDEFSQLASTLVADMVTQAVQAANSDDVISQFVSDLVDMIVESVLNEMLASSKGLTVGELLDSDSKTGSSRSTSQYAEELTSVIISNALQSIAQEENDSNKQVPTSFNEQLSFRLQGLATGRYSPNKQGLKPSAVRTPSGWNECMMSLHLSASSRKTNSMIWSSAATVNEGSDPPSPSELASLCLDETTDCVSEFAADLSSQMVAEVVSGIVDSNYEYPRVNTLNSAAPLKEADEDIDFPGDGLSLLANFTPRWSNKNFSLLRPVITGNWGVGAYNGDAQLKSLLQWMAVSASGRTQMIYFTDCSPCMEKFEAVCTHVLDTTPTVGKLGEAVLAYCTLKSQQKEKADLFTFLLSQTT